uniref:TUBA3 n=1 Tax=Arundo donax TaxID=35708 RepID=A0A0A9DTQ4_ARUDO
MTTGEVVGRILLAADELLRVEELAVGTSAHLIDHSGLKIKEDGTGRILPCAGLTIEGAEGVIMVSGSLVSGHLAIRLRGTENCLIRCQL